VFKYLQIISAEAMSFAHGANDVANAVGPFAAIYGVYQYGYISPKSTVEPWMLAGIGASGEMLDCCTCTYPQGALIATLSILVFSGHV
jgi:sodium-dependent phosphate transporter